MRGAGPQLESPRDEQDEENMRTNYKPARNGYGAQSGRSQNKGMTVGQNHHIMLAHPEILNNEF